MKVDFKKFWADFRSFAIKGNVIDMAVGVIVGGAFSKIVSSLVSDMIMPVIGFMIGGINFKEWKIKLADVIKDSSGKVLREAVYINYGKFIEVILDFLIIAFFIFLVVKAISKAKEALNLKLAEEEDTLKKDKAKSENTILLEEIRDLLKKKE